MPGTGRLVMPAPTLVPPPPPRGLSSPPRSSPPPSPRPSISLPLSAPSTAAASSPSHLPLPPSGIYEFEAVIAQKAAALEELKADIATLRVQVGLQQKRRAAELQRERERRVDAILDELLPLPEELQEPVPTVAPSLLPAAVPASPRPAAPAQVVTPRTVPLTVSSRRAPPPAPSRTPAVPKRAVPPRPKEPEMAPAAAALLTSMHESKYSRPFRGHR